MPRKRVRTAQEPAPEGRGGYVAGGVGDRRLESQERKLKDVKPWRKIPHARPYYAVVVMRTRIAVLEGGGEAQEPQVEYVVGPYKLYKPADAAAKRWTTGSWSAEVVPLQNPSRFTLEEEV